MCSLHMQKQHVLRLSELLQYDMSSHTEIQLCLSADGRHTSRAFLRTQSVSQAWSLTVAASFAHKHTPTTFADELHAGSQGCAGATPLPCWALGPSIVSSRAALPRLTKDACCPRCECQTHVVLFACVFIIAPEHA